MKIVDAYWETENIGYKTVEITFAEVSDRYPEEATMDYNHLVLKIPCCLTSLIHQMEGRGYNYVENQFCLTKKLAKFNIDDKIIKLSNLFDFVKIANAEELDIIINNINNGIFNTDRIYLDPMLGEALSKNRYSNWIKSMFANTSRYSIFFITEKKTNTKIGFCCLDHSDEKIYKGILAGMFEMYKQSGLGFLIVYFPLMYSISNNVKSYKTFVSSNNLEILNLYSYFSFQFEECYSVLRKIR